MDDLIQRRGDAGRSSMTGLTLGARMIGLHRLLLHLFPFILVSYCGHASAQWIPHVILDQQPKLDSQFCESQSKASASPKEWNRDLLVGSPYCEVSVPATRDKKQSMPVLLYLSPGPVPQSYLRWKTTLRRKGFLFVAPHHVGNHVAVEDRIRRAVLALDHVRQNYNVDPDRTYVVGFSGGARVARFLAYSYPECFGGLIQLGSGGSLPSDDWLLDRIVERLRVALIVGKRDGFLPEVELSTYITLRETGVETRLWTPSIGHTLPAARILDEAIRWLDEGLDERRSLAIKFPSTRLTQLLAADDHAQAFLNEARLRIQIPEHRTQGIALLAGVSQRWGETEAGAEAEREFEQYSQNDEGWKREIRGIRVRRLVAFAKGNEAFATTKVMHKYFEIQRPQMTRSAIEAWRAVYVLATDNDLKEESIAALKRLGASTTRGEPFDAPKDRALHFGNGNLNAGPR